MVELGNHASRDLLVELARAGGHPQLEQAFTAALATEKQHEETVRTWLRQAVFEEAT